MHRRSSHLVTAALTTTLGISSLNADTLHVPGDYPTIQACIDAAQDGDLCLVAPGDYPEQIDFDGKAVTLRSTAGPDVTFITAQGPGAAVTCNSGEGPDTVLDGFSIVGAASEFAGGGLFAFLSDPTVLDCVFSGNSALAGGGIYLADSDMTVTGCTFVGNTAVVEGGAIQVQQGSCPSISSCTFLANTVTGNQSFSGSGGAIAFVDLDGPATLAGCTFSGNVSNGVGGGMSCRDLSPLVIDCRFEDNIAEEGGGLYFRDGLATLVDCVIDGNTAHADGGGVGAEDSTLTFVDCAVTQNRADAGFGGGMHQDGGSLTLTRCEVGENIATGLGGGLFVTGLDAVVTSCTIRANEANAGAGVHCLTGSSRFANSGFYGNAATGSNGFGGGLFASFDTLVSNCTFVNNYAAIGGGGVHLDSEGVMTMANTILWLNTADLFAAQISSGGQSTIRYCNVEGGLSGANVVDGGGNLDADPLFVDPNANDFRLAAGSPAVDAGSNADVPADLADLDGDGDTDETLPLDLGGQPRLADDPEIADTGLGGPPVVDMGAHERMGIGSCPADINGDGHVDVLDLIEMILAWGGGSGPADVNDDGIVDVLDLVQIILAWGSCG